MIEYSDFEGPFLDMVRLCGYSNTVKSIRAFYEKLKYTDPAALFKGFDLLTADESPPHKLTLASIKSFIRQTRLNVQQAKWDGTPCDNCDSGLIWEKRDGYSYIFRCTKCKSYHVENFEWHTPENVFKLDCKIKEIKKAREEGQTMFISRESRVS